jgi:hypothetical protein
MIMHYKHLICTAFMAIMTTLTAAGQGYNEGLNAFVNYFPLTVPKPEKVRFPGEQVKVNLNLPIYLNTLKSKYLVAGASFESLGFGGQHPNFPLQQLYGFQPSIGYCSVLNDRWTVLASFQPSLSSDFSSISTRDVIWGGGVRVSYVSSPTLSFRFTMGYRQQFFGPQYLPLFGFDWKISERWRMFGDLPTVGTLAYKLNSIVNLGVYYLGNNYSFRLPNQRQYLKYTFTTPGVFAEVYATSKWVMRLTASYCVSRTLSIYDADDKPGATILFIRLGHKPLPLNPDVNGGAELKITMSYRIQTR